MFIPPEFCRVWVIFLPQRWMPCMLAAGTLGCSPGPHGALSGDLLPAAGARSPQGPGASQLLINCSQSYF